MITQCRLKRLLRYSKATGVFVWIERTSNRICVGDVAGNVDRLGYVQIRIDGRLYQAHNLAWLYVHGVWPIGLIDHRDLDRANNRIRNLRIATKMQNSWNGPMRANNRSGLKGAHFHAASGLYRARIRVAGITYSLGYFVTAAQAHDAYCAASLKLHGEFGRTH